jgi:DNA (cytosine-5)-methyltransferase 1
MTSTALYNENDPFAASWLENLITHGHIAQGTVDRRSIVELTPADVAGPGQRHFFGGIGGWSYALRRAGVADGCDVWTGSCPCQPFSDAGKGGGVLDARHLWPAWFALIGECRPPVIFGEQVASRDGIEWLDLVFADLERCGYAVGAADLCAAGVGAPHQRQRLYFMAYAPGDRRVQGIRVQLSERRPDAGLPQAHRSCEDGGMANATSEPSGRRRKRGASGWPTVQPEGHGVLGHVADPSRPGLEVEREQQAQRQLAPTERGGEAGVPREGHGGTRNDRRLLDAPAHAGATRGFWGDAEWLLCRCPAGGSPIARPVESGTFPLVAGVPGRVGLLRGYGNAITTEVAVTFIRSALDAIP